ncbi:MAG: metallophosphoesterase [Pirellulaceae bacterium]|nr:metallophosphoesterase [Pirellulaceae bacterium]
MLAPNLSRREFLAATGSTAGALALTSAQAAAPASETVAFVLVGDTHYLANKELPTEIDPISAGVNGRLIETINRMPGLAISPAAGGGEVAALRGVIHAGDLIDTGDKTGTTQQRMQETEWQHFVADYGLNGKDGRLKVPVYEVHGNHDGPRGEGIAISGIQERNRRRPGLRQVSSGGLHYSWDWGPVHFVNLGIVVGPDASVTLRRRYNPRGSLDFLREDLKATVGDSGRPVVITHHIDILRYSGACDPNEPANLNKEWHPCDVQAFYQALQGFNVVAILYGHTHARNVLKWNGTATKADTGLNLFNVDNSGHFHNDQQALMYFEIAADHLLVRELATRDRWQTAEWTPQFWKLPVAKA